MEKKALIAGITDQDSSYLDYNSTAYYIENAIF